MDDFMTGLPGLGMWEMIMIFLVVLLLLLGAKRFRRT